MNPEFWGIAYFGFFLLSFVPEVSEFPFSFLEIVLLNILNVIIIELHTRGGGGWGLLRCSGSLFVFYHI